MSIRDFLIKLLGSSTSLDKHLFLRIVTRDAEGVVETVRHVPVSGLFDENTLRVEWSDIVAAEVE